MKPALRSKLNAREFATTWNMLHIASRLNSDLGAIIRSDKMMKLIYRYTKWKNISLNNKQYLNILYFYFIPNNIGRPDIPDVVSLIRRIHALESSLNATKIKSDELLKQRREVANYSTSLLLSNHSELTKLIGKYDLYQMINESSLCNE